MLNKITTYTAVCLVSGITLIVVAAIFLYLQPVSSADNATVVKVRTITSHVNAGGRMAMKHSVAGEMQIGSSVTIGLDFILSPGQLLELEFVDNEQYQFIQQPDVVYSTDDRGRLSVELRVTPLVAGKIYIKFLASTTDGQRVRSFSIPLKIKASDGLVPQTSGGPKSRINLPVKGSY